MANIAVVDDSQASIDMIVNILQGANHTVTAYTKSPDVEKSIAANKPDLILLDVVMPERNGYEVLRALRKDSTIKDIPVVLVSSKSETTDVRWGLRQGASAYITKPFTPEAILSTVGEQLT